MKIENFEMVKVDAYRKWKEYVSACKKNPKDDFLRDMKKVYNQLKSGRKVIDILKVFKKAGNKMGQNKFQPKLAIAQAHLKEVFCLYNDSGKVYFQKDDCRWLRDRRSVKVILTSIPEGILSKYNHTQTLKCPVPGIPASIRPKGDLRKYYILWEVEKWENVPPKDPYLLRRITKNMFVVLAGWNLTELERAVLSGRMI